MKKRKAQIIRNTTETQINLELNIDGSGKRKIDIPVGFLTHMLDLFAKHGLFDLKIKATGDIYIDEHHTVEDIGIVLGEAFLTALSNKKGINRYGFFVLPDDEKFQKALDKDNLGSYGFFVLPMDEALATVAIDFAGRYSFRFDCQFINPKVGDLNTDLIWHFWDAFAQNAKVNLYIKVENGRNDHHIAEAMFKAVARAIRMAIQIGPRAKNQIPSTKGRL
ncbi:imidazoleglycerol-phosphate dehydratase [Candidatus Daviesbacteria bacterium]|nr:imidazoleglycerol-phosphate dehydratase [Candidatus Daviesbacteria bacterium]